MQRFLRGTAPLSLGRCGVNVLGTGVKPFPWLCSCPHSPGCCWLALLLPHVLTSHVLPFHPGAQSAQPRASGDGCFTRGFLETPLLPLEGPALQGLSDFLGSFTLQSCCPCCHLVRHPELIKVFSSGAPALCFAAGLSPCPSVPGPHNFLAVAAPAGTDEHIPDQLFLAGQAQIPVSIPLFPYQAALLSHHCKSPTLLEPFALPGHECQGSCHSPWEPAHWPGHPSRLPPELFCQLSLMIKEFLNCQDSVLAF